MTREEAIRRKEAIRIWGKKLCEDAISRQAVLELVADYDLSMGQVVKGIHALPTVNPQPKTGHWIDHQEDRWIYAKCSECGSVRNTQTNYCPNCGARMVESQESED